MEMKQYKKTIDSGRQKKKKNRFWQAAAEVLRFPRENACPENVLKTLEGCPNLKVARSCRASDVFHEKTSLALQLQSTSRI